MTNSKKITPFEENNLKFGISAIGRTDYKKFTEGKRLTCLQAIRAKCYECVAGYDDGRYDCTVSNCPLYPFMPYKGKHPKTSS